MVCIGGGYVAIRAFGTLINDVAVDGRIPRFIDTEIIAADARADSADLHERLGLAGKGGG